METPKALPGKMQMIDGEGMFFSSETEKFLEEPKKSSSTSSHYTVISIIGRQSGGKSYLLNSLFGTQFDVLDASKGRNQTTKGIWIAKCISPSIIIMDVEGYEGKEREKYHGKGKEAQWFGKSTPKIESLIRSHAKSSNEKIYIDTITNEMTSSKFRTDTLFERQSALFSLTVSDVLLLNMKHDDVGCVLPPLLPLIFQERVNMDTNKEFASKTNLIICVRDYNYETPVEKNKEDLEKAMNKLWNEVHPATTNRKMSDYIEVIVKDFPHKKEKEFDGKSKDLAEFLWQFCTNGSQQHKHYAFTFARGLQEIWNLIRKNKTITAADYKVAMSKLMCEESKKEILGSLDKWMEYKYLMSGESMPVKEFNNKLKIFLTNITTRYDKETTGFEGVIREQVKENLVKKIIKIFKPTFEKKIDSLCAYTLSKAKSEIRDELKRISVLDVSTVTDAIRPYMAIFNNNSRPDVQPHLKEILRKKRVVVAEGLIKIAGKKADYVEIERLFITTVKIYARLAVATAWAHFTFDPSMLIVGTAKSARDIYKAVRILRNRDVCVDDIIDAS